MSLELNFIPNTLGCYGLNVFLKEDTNDCIDKGKTTDTICRKFATNKVTLPK